jgi:hypothetical protein
MNARDPYTTSVAVLVLLGLGGAIGILLGAAGIADAATLDLQLPYLASGGVGGLALVIVAAGLGSAQRRRLARAREREAMADVLAHAEALLADLRERPRPPRARRAPRQLKATR